ncbi:MAG TPA: hypothetical protein VE619_09410, partial [Nitrososphaeraceae archaeon]|nr:hypothetical protein [Nitrososphaeraceae archaeon]
MVAFISLNIIAATFIIILLSAIFASTIAIITTKQFAFGDGLTQEQLSASLGNRKADLLIKMIPPVVTTETLQTGQKPIIEFRLFDSNTNQSFSHVTYYIIILQRDGKRLVSDMFHDHNGDLKIQVDPSNINKTVTFSGAEQDPLLGILTQTTQTNPIVASGPIFLTGGLYRFIVRIETVDSDYTLLSYNQEPVYDSWLSIGDVYNNKWSYQNHDYNTTLISYYDKINSINFDPTNKVLSWTMPFD